MVTKTIQITGIIATSGRYNRIQFEIVNDDGTTTPVVYPSGRRDNDSDSLAVDSSVYSLAQAIYFSGATAKDRKATATLYLDSRCCCCCTKLHVEGIYTLGPVS